MKHKTGILLVNIGTPDAPTSEAVRDFLAEFLDDPYVVDYPRFLWKLILHGIILRTRPARSARLYQKIWTGQGSPLMLYMEEMLEKLSQHFEELVFEIGMRYGSPSLQTGLEKLREKGAAQIIVIPLYPQYSTTTTGTSLEALYALLEDGDWPDMISTR